MLLELGIPFFFIEDVDSILWEIDKRTHARRQSDYWSYFCIVLYGIYLFVLALSSFIYRVSSGHVTILYMSKQYVTTA